MGQGIITRHKKTLPNVQKRAMAQTPKKQMTRKVTVSKQRNSVVQDTYDDTDSIADNKEESAVVVNTSSQKTVTTLPAKTEDSPIYETAEQQASFPGGEPALMTYLSNHIHYPTSALKDKVQGRVICSFIVEKDGAISNVTVLKSVESSLDKEAVRVVSSMPKWTPGKIGGNPVRCKYVIPITFRL